MELKQRRSASAARGSEDESVGRDASDLGFRSQEPMALSLRRSESVVEERNDGENAENVDQRQHLCLLLPIRQQRCFLPSVVLWLSTQRQGCLFRKRRHLCSDSGQRWSQVS